MQNRPQDFLLKIRKNLKNTQQYLKIETLGEESKAELLQRKEKLEGVLAGAVK